MMYETDRAVRAERRSAGVGRVSRRILRGRAFEPELEPIEKWELLRGRRDAATTS